MPWGDERSVDGCVGRAARKGQGLRARVVPLLQESFGLRGRGPGGEGGSEADDDPNRGSVASELVSPGSAGLQPGSVSGSFPFGEFKEKNWKNRAGLEPGAPG